MKFVFFIASTMLIVLINQHSTMGLPVTDDTPLMTITAQMPVLNKDPERKFGACPEGMVHGKHGICQEKELTETTTTALKDMEFTQETVVAKKDPERPKDGACPEGMVHGEHGRCQKVELTETTTVPKDMELTETTTVRKINLNDCPKGTKKDEQGSCQEIEPTDTKKVTTDPKMFLEKDGSCPLNYKMVNGTCLYIKPKLSPPLYPVLLNGAKPKSGNAEIFEYEQVPMNADGSCPEGTEYSGFKSCQRRISPSKSKFDIKADGKCPADFELIDGKCRSKNSKEKDQSSEALTTSASPLPSEGTTVAAEPKVDGKSKIETDPVKESSEALTTSASPLPSEGTTVAAEPKVDRKSKDETANVKESSAEWVSTTSQPL